MHQEIFSRLHDGVEPGWRCQEDFFFFFLREKKLKIKVQEDLMSVI